MADDLVRVKGLGAELAIGKDAPGFLDRVLPGWAARRGKEAVLGRILDKVRNGDPTDDADEAYARSVLGRDEARWMRETQILARAERIVQERGLLLPAHAAPDASSADGTVAPSVEDWKNLFWEDAGLLTDETMQEAYARLLVDQAERPGTCSKLTLQALRYMDRETAEGFARLAPAILGTDLLPRDGALLESVGVSHALVLQMDDAGLLESGTSTSWYFEGTAYAAYGTKRLQIVSAARQVIPAYPVRRSGRDLLRVANFTFDEAYFIRAAQWMRQKMVGAQLRWAEAPTDKWAGQIEELQWLPVPD